MILLFVLFGFVMCSVYIYFTETNHSKTTRSLSPAKLEDDGNPESAISSKTFTEADSVLTPVETSKTDDDELLEKDDSVPTTDILSPSSEDVDAKTIFDATTQELRTKIQSLKTELEELSNELKTYTAAFSAVVTTGICSTPKFFGLRGLFFTLIFFCISVVSSTSIFPQFNNLPTTTTSLASLRLPPNLTQSNNFMTEYQRTNLDASTFRDNITYDDIINDPQIKATVDSIDRNEMIKFVTDGLKSINHLVELK